MRSRGSGGFQTIRVEGAILPPDLLQRVADGDRSLGGLNPADYHLVGNEKLNEATNRSWNRILGAWSAFVASAEKLPGSDPKTSLTRERWLLPLFQELGYGRLTTARAIELSGKSFAVSHSWGSVPIHLIGCGVELDVRSEGVAGAARMTPHGLVQELLNGSDDYLWGFVSNGLRLRILRDNSSLTRQAYVEFDLEAMMAGEAYSDFALLWLLCHQSRVEAEKIEECWLEKWSRAAQEQGTRALDQLRDGVTSAISALGSGFISHPANRELIERLQSGALDKQDFYRQLLRLVYRLLFIFVAEDRDLLFAPDTERETRERYTRYYSTSRIRRLAGRKRGTKHPDLYYTLRLVMQKLGSDEGCPELGLPALGSFLFSPEAIADIETCEIANSDLLAAIRALAYTLENGTLRPVDYRNLGSEELGSVYESLLELHPELNLGAGVFELRTAAGNERKTTGSYYTPTGLIQILLDSALDPVLDEALKKPNPEEALLALKVCDPACGSGHFLIAAAHRIAKRVASVRTGDIEPSPEATRTALRQVISKCIYGVDINPMSVELCKVALWMEAIDPGKPLSFLDHHIQCGNSLIGATPRLLREGIPDAAFQPVEGDDKAVCSEYRKRNKQERESGQQSLFGHDLQPWEQLSNLATAMMSLDADDDGSVAAEHRKQERYEKLVESTDYEYGRLLADTWCAAFFWKKNREFDYPITEEVYRRIERNPHSISAWMKNEVRHLASQNRFFHWHLAFPDVFRVPGRDEEPENDQTGWAGGFDCVVGNPPYVAMYSRDSTKTGNDALRTFVSTTDWKIDGREALSGRINYFLMFLVRSVHIGNGAGVGGLVLPDTIVTNKAYASCRFAFTVTGRLRQVVLFRQPVFSQATVGTALVTWGGPHDDPHYATFIAAENVGSGSTAGLATFSESLAMISVRSDCNWQPIPGEEQQSAGLPESGTVAISEIAHVKDGINPGPKEMRDILLTKSGQRDAHLRRCLEGKNIERFRISFASLYVHYNPEMVTSEAKKKGTSLREEWIFTSPKIVYRQTAPHVIAAVDLRSFYAVNSVHSIVLLEYEESVLLALCGYLNSRFFREYYQKATGETRKTFPQVHISSMRSLRVPAEILDGSSDLTVRMAEITRALSAGSDGLPPSSAPCACVDSNKLQSDIDDLVDTLVARVRDEARR